MRTAALKMARQKAGLSQVELATKLGVAPSTVAAWELGIHSIRTSRLPALARVLSVDVMKLLG